MAKKKRPQTPPSRLDLLTARINHWSRPLRIAMTTFITLVIVVIVGYIVDRLLLQAVYDEELSAWVPTIIMGVVGLGTYGGGWWLLVGFDWNVDKPWQARRASTIFVLAGLFGFGIVLLGLLSGLVFGYLL